MLKFNKKSRARADLGKTTTSALVFRGEYRPMLRGNR